jgi:hypothetical protein
VEAWQIAQPENPDAIVLRAEVEVVRVFRIAARDGSAPLDGLDAAAPDLNDKWIGNEAVSDLEVALGRWFCHRRQAFAQDVPDLHYLAHGLCFANRAPAAAPVFQLIGGLLVSTPWSLFGDAATVFSYWRKKALGLAR